eukprot:TRINITY_DN687_c0_g1_i4.p1 TRINITY_DN687_c0_g1~~TRINITY_DN687_c0_g1_i4.p1  ORF type:complete len:1290 (+),score=322.70 TRINITY_DN687_c0_g1_i4:294-4163(+)
MNVTKFTTWTQENRGISDFTKWLLSSHSILLSDDVYVPTFHETLAEYCKLSKKDVWDLERKFYLLKSKSETSKFDLKFFNTITSPPLPMRISTELFKWLDQNKDGYLDIVEMAKGVAYLCRFENTKRIQTMFNLFDKDGDGVLSRQELREALEELFDLLYRNQLEMVPVQQKINLDSEVDEILKTCIEGDKTRESLSLTEFINWGSRDGCVLEELLKVMFQLCHIVFGLRPQSREDERDVIKGYMVREMREKLQEGTIKYLIANPWFNSWQDFVEYDPRSTLVRYSNKHSKHHVNKPSKQKRNKQTDNTYYQEEYEQYEVAADNEVRKYHGPGPINNKILCQYDARNKACSVLTGEGGILKQGQQEDVHFVTLPEPVWKALASWYEGTYPLPRVAYTNRDTGNIELELNPINLAFLKHTSFPSRYQASKQGETGGITALSIFQYFMNLSGAGPSSPVGQPQNLNAPGVLNPIYRQHSYYGAFSRYATIKQIQEFIVGIFKLKSEEVRLWEMGDDETPILLEEEEKSLEELGYTDKQRILIEIRNKDNSWPEEVIQVMRKVQRQESEKGNVPQAVGQGKVLKGCTGLTNLGNTCYMNSAFQCLSNTPLFTQYFLVGRHLKELNKINPLGTKGVLAKRYGELVHDLWSGNNRTVAPIKFKWTLGRFEPQFNHFTQQDAQELLSVLLDRLHEDLNLVINKPYKELPDSGGRPDFEVSQEHWDYHLKRNRSIVVQLFQGQLKSIVRCKECGYTSVKFDPFTFLTLPLPADSDTNIDVFLIRLGGKTPERYSLKIDIEAHYSDIKLRLEKESGVKKEEIIFTDVYAGTVRSIVPENQKIKCVLTGQLYAFQIPPCPIVEPTARADSPDTIFRQRKLSQLTKPSQDLPTENNITATPCINGDIELKPLKASSTLDEEEMVQGERFIFAFHRKCIPTDTYFVTSQKSRPQIFAQPICIPFTPGNTNRTLYEYVMESTKRLLSDLPESCDTGADNKPEFPFNLKMVYKDGVTCARCPWYTFCRGCPIPCDETAIVSNVSFIGIDWQPGVLHLRYQYSEEKAIIDKTPRELQQLPNETPVDLHQCLEAFSREEELGGDERWFCKKCDGLQSATKKLEIFRLPPFLIIHLKRFQFTNGRWAKSQVPVTFPFSDLQPIPSESEPQQPNSEIGMLQAATPNDINKEIEITPVEPEDHTSRNKVYDLYAMTTHYGYLGGGHYVSFAKSEVDDNWYYYNDSSCKQTDENRVSKEPPYLLFYKQQGELNIEKISGELHDFQTENDSDDESEELPERSRFKCPVM